MATLTLKASIPAIRLVPGMQLRLEAVDAASGAAVAGVTATRWAIYGDDEGGTDTVTESGPMMFVPGPAPVEAPAAPPGSTGGAGAYPGIH